MTTRTGVALSVLFALAASGCGGQKLTPDQTQAEMREYMLARSIECGPGAHGWDYLCDVDFGDWQTEIGVDVDEDSITDQTAP